jgi:hypothetical protein
MIGREPDDLKKESKRENPNVQTVYRIIEALENPDAPQRLEAIAAGQRREKKWIALERYGAVLSNLFFIGLSLFLLNNIRIEKNPDLSYWYSILTGGLLTIGVIGLSKIWQKAVPKPVPPLQLLALGGLFIALIFLANEVRKHSSPALQSFLTTTLLSFLMTLSSYDLIINLRKCWNKEL